MDEAHRLHAHGRATFDAAALDSAERRFRYLAPRAGERSGEIHFALGGTLAALGRHDEAAAAYSLVRRLEPRNVAALENLAIAVEDGGRIGEAAALYEAALRLAPASQRLSSLGKLELQLGRTAAGAARFREALRLTPSDARTYYDFARSTELFNGGDDAVGLFHASQRLAARQWRAAMGCAPSVDALEPGVARWSGGALHRRVLVGRGGAAYSAAPKSPPPRWPHLRFVERDTYLVELHDVWLSGNEGVVSDDACALYLPSHGSQLALFDALPTEPPAAREADSRIRRVGYGFDEDDARDGDDVLLLSLAQIFAANFYSFFADGLGRLVAALDALSDDERRRLRVAVPSDRGKLRGWMWPLLERLGVGRHNAWPFAVRPHFSGAAEMGAARMRVRRLVVVDWAPAADAEGALAADAARNDTAHLPTRHALTLLRDRFASPGAHAGWATARRTMVYLGRAAASLRAVANEEALLEALAVAAADAGWTLEVLGDAPSPPLAAAAARMAAAGVVVGVHGAGWANLLFVGGGAQAVELALPEPHAIYAAHLAAALGIGYECVPLDGTGLHSAPRVPVRVGEVARAVRRAMAAHEALYFAKEDEASCPTPSVELVVARYDEDVSWVAAYANTTVYNKGAMMEKAAAARVIALPNRGREAGTWLHHIVANYDRLADRTVFLQGDPFDHLLPGVGIDRYLNGTEDVFLPLTAVARADLDGLAFRDGYAPWPPFSGALQPIRDGWARRNARRLPALLQPYGLWRGELGYNRSEVAVERGDEPGLPLLRTRLHWIDERAEGGDGAAGLRAWWRRWFGEEVPELLFHNQGAQFALSRAAVRRRERGWYAALLEEVGRSVDPVESYYLELAWGRVFSKG
jgi:tetratricopeptide (TPR) repeat protein/nucleotide-binding universal stress UspA family protein